MTGAQPSARLIWVRHGESEWNAGGIWQGQADSPLTDRGHDQAQATARRLESLAPNPLLIARSDLDRVVQTAAPIEAALGVPVLVDPRLRELDVGAWSGRTHAEIAADDPDAVAAFERGEDVRVGGGERLADLRARIDAMTAELAALAAPRGATVVIVSHGWPCRLAAAAAIGLGPGAERKLGRVSNCALSIIEHTGDDAVLTSYNRTDHLAEVAAPALVA